MKSRTVVLALMCCMVVGLAPLAEAANTMTIESKTVAPGSTGVEIGVFLVNDFDLGLLVVPLEVRSIDVDAFTANSFTFVEQGRVAGSGLQDFHVGPNLFPTPVAAGPDQCSGPTSNSYPAASPGAADFVSPDGMSYVGVVAFTTAMAAGDDGAIPSFLLTFDVTVGPGQFEIDTCCITPANHLLFGDVTGDPSGTVVPDFTKGIITIGGNAVQGVGGAVPTTFRIDQNYPNPFNAGTVIPFGVAYDSHVRIDVYDILGRRIATVADDDFIAGNYNADWDGRDKNGSPVATGVYFYRFVSDEMTETRKMVVLK